MGATAFSEAFWPSSDTHHAIRVSLPSSRTSFVTGLGSFLSVTIGTNTCPFLLAGSSYPEYEPSATALTYCPGFSFCVGLYCKCEPVVSFSSRTLFPDTSQVTASSTVLLMYSSRFSSWPILSGCRRIWLYHTPTQLRFSETGSSDEMFSTSSRSIPIGFFHHSYFSSCSSCSIPGASCFSNIIALAVMRWSGPSVSWTLDIAWYAANFAAWRALKSYRD